MTVTAISVGPLHTNCYVVSKNNVGVVIDPGFEEWKIQEHIQGIDIQYIFLTHGHYDHFAAAKGIAEKTGAKIVISEVDRPFLDDVELNLICWNMSLVKKQISADITVKDGDTLTVGDMNFKFMLTPGHTPGSMCIYIDNLMFSGDTLFCGTVGRTDLPGGSMEQMMNSLQNIIKPIQKDYIVYPGHLDSTTLFYEKENNPYLR
ncbi:MAG: MBL fold metallo-hydrolase [Ruminococcaceae bacterium]|nr:MBL fold metallo-hydrolase [Oscillospiraceae bacterium]